LKLFEIRDSSQVLPDRTDRIQGYLFYYSRSRRFYAEILSELDQWTAPAMFMKHMKQGRYSIDHEWTMKWVQQRIIPAERQNIGAILRENHLKEYDPYRLLCLSEGRCAQDESYIRKIDPVGLPEEIRDRLMKKVQDVMPLTGHRICVFFRDDTAKIIKLDPLIGVNRLFANILAHDDILRQVRVSPGGNGIEWDDTRYLPAEDLYGAGIPSAIRYEELLEFARTRLEDTSALSQRMNVSRQYINQLVKQNRLNPVVTGATTQIFARAEIESEMPLFH